MTTKRWSIAGVGFLLAALTSEPFSPVWTDLHLPLAVLQGLFAVGTVACVATLLASVPYAALIPDSRFDCRRIQRDEAKRLLRWTSSLIPDPPSFRVIKQVLQVNPHTIFLATRTWRFPGIDITRKVGFCSLLPLTAAAVPLLEDEEIDGLRFTATHICTPKVTPTALYIGSIAAKGWRNRAEIIAFVKGKIDDAEQNGVKILYTRPVTRDGLRLARKYGFVAVADRVDEGELRRIYRRVSD